MNEKLIQYLKDNQKEFIGLWEQRLHKEWNSRIASDSMSGNQHGTRAPTLSPYGPTRTDETFSILVERYYQDLLLHLNNQKGLTYLQEDFPHYSPYGIRLTLGSLLELLLTGEDTFSQIFLEEVNSSFTGIKGIDAFDEISRSLREIFKGYSQKFCNECTRPLVKAIRHLASHGKQQPIEEKEAYDGYPYSNEISYKPAKMPTPNHS
jgi:hypothetical protein